VRKTNKPKADMKIAKLKTEIRHTGRNQAQVIQDGKVIESVNGRDALWALREKYPDAIKTRGEEIKTKQPTENL
jgi:hypothetical protein